MDELSTETKQNKKSNDPTTHPRVFFTSNADSMSKRSSIPSNQNHKWSDKPNNNNNHHILNFSGSYSSLTSPKQIFQSPPSNPTFQPLNNGKINIPMPPKNPSLFNNASEPSISTRPKRASTLNNSMSKYNKSIQILKSKQNHNKSKLNSRRNTISASVQSLFSGQPSQQPKRPELEKRQSFKTGIFPNSTINVMPKRNSMPIRRANNPFAMNSKSSTPQARNSNHYKHNALYHLPTLSDLNDDVICTLPDMYRCKSFKTKVQPTPFLYGDKSIIYCNDIGISS